MPLSEDEARRKSILGFFTAPLLQRGRRRKGSVEERRGILPFLDGRLYIPDESSKPL
ncbi:hypothetical protein POREN0001_0901 [Porphyromonas endodontalis ATCC 35406]|uniref:Uncharacterized protein n=1 Tax=Porphyromonas endodontalis (strain ATCC 35406 / DSM 24491 / JCM 8526 / CCUG 16442 / BCRC 14492 / NCTC 13058 / HG 370) TaxID=553175 RepID=C3J9X8_POREA|nr:hypothetical protein POREN0001_0901 [Porphyromonas endodontalis ATCC 35406]